MEQQKKPKKISKINKSIRMFYGELCVFTIFSIIAILMIWHYFSVGSWVVDNSLSNFMNSIRSPLLDSVFRFITFTGETVPVVLMTALVIILFIFFKHYKEAAFVALYMLGVWQLNELLKDVISRPRPDISLWLVKTTGLSMPSGHAMNFMAFMLISLYFVWVYSKNKKLNITLTAVMVTYAILVGLSRIYLHVHYASDVITGWSLGAACAAMAVVIHRVWTESETKEKSGE